MTWDALAQIKDFDGTGDPKKCAVIVKISGKGEYEFYKSICPD